MSYKSRVRGLLRHAATDGSPELDAHIQKLFEYARHFVYAERDPLLEVEAKRLLVDAAYNLALAARDIKAIGRVRNAPNTPGNGTDLKGTDK